MASHPSIGLLIRALQSVQVGNLCKAIGALLALLMCNVDNKQCSDVLLPFDMEEDL